MKGKFPNISMIILGFTCGLPYMFLFSTLGVWLRESGATLTSIGFLSWMVLAYSLKFLWSPLVDKYSVPSPFKLSRRKAWIFLAQLIIFCALLALGFTADVNNLFLIFVLGLVVAVSGSFQDIAVDALRIEMGESKDQGNFAASYQFGYRAAILVATSAALILAEAYSWDLIFIVLAFLMLIGSFAIFLAPEPLFIQESEENYLSLLASSAKDFFNRFGMIAASILLVIVATYRLTDILVGPMTMPFYIDMGFNKIEIGSIVKIVALIASIFGFFFGGLLIKNLSIKKALIIGGLLVLLTNIGFGVFALTEKNLTLLSGVVALDSFAAGIVGTVNIAFLTSLVSKKFVATQYALLTSFMMLPGKIFGGLSGLLADFLIGFSSIEVGWAIFFAITSMLALPALLLIVFSKAVNES
ncbi:MAG: MFS transporter [Gammaproteobacteria bacterium]